MWRAKIGQIGVLLCAIGLLTLIFFFQDCFVRRPVLYDRLRLAFLVFTLFWIGWYAQAQLSVVNVLAFLSALRTDFRWDYFLMAPLIFILWFATAASRLVLESRRLLRLALPVRGAAGTDEPPRETHRRFRSSKFPSASISG